MRVAINSLSIAERELSHRDEAERAEYAGLKTLLIDLNVAEEPLSEGTADMIGAADSLADLRWRLVAALRENRPLDREVLAEHLRQTVAHRLSIDQPKYCLLYTSPSPRDLSTSRMPSSA